MSTIDFETKEKQLLEQTANGNMEAMYLLGLHYYNNEYMEKAYTWFDRAAHLGHGDSYYYLGLLYENASGYSWAKEKPVRNLLQAAIYYAVGTDRKSAKATFKVGRLYLYGELDTPVDTQKGIEYLQKAVRLKSAEACEELALCYEKGIGVEIDLKKSAKYAKKAAELVQNEN